MPADGVRENRGIITFEPEPSANGANIKVIGIGGGGGNAVNRMKHIGLCNPLIND